MRSGRMTATKGGLMAKTTVAKSRGAKAQRHGKLRASAKDAATENNRNWPAATLSERKSIEQLAAEQGTKPTRLEDILGKGADGALRMAKETGVESGNVVFDV